MTAEIRALIALTVTPGFGAIKIRNALHHYGSADEVIKAYPKDTFSEPLDQAEEEIEIAKKNEIDILPFTSPDYPPKLLKINNFPFILYARGKLPSSPLTVAVIGTRFHTTYGGEMAEKISYELAGNGITIVSGLARGIDTAAHIGALKGGTTIAVLGSGFGHLYPKENTKLADQIAEKGAVLTEYPFRAGPQKHHFPERNRIVSGLSDATLLIEAPLKSGAMITVEEAIRQGRAVFALPGRADTPHFEGNHRLIKNKEAALATQAADILASFNQLPLPLKQAKPVLETDEIQLLKTLPNEEITFDLICQRTNLPVPKLNILLISLLLKRAIREYPGKTYRKIIDP